LAGGPLKPSFDLKRAARYCSQNPGTCLMIAVGAATVAAQPEIAPFLPAFF
jgi:hypothetical protein